MVASQAPTHRKSHKLYKFDKHSIGLKTLHIQNIDVEFDVQVIFYALQMASLYSSSLGLIIDDCKIVSSDIINYSFVFALRLTNQVAYTLARATCSMDDHIASTSDHMMWVVPTTFLIFVVLFFDLYVNKSSFI